MSRVVQCIGGWVIVDDEDVPLATRYRWRVDKAGYARRKVGTAPAGKPRHFLLHRVIAGAPKGVEVDHVNGDPRDNRRCNLRLCTRAENSRNVRPMPFRKHGLPFKGISPSGQRWAAFIETGHKQRYLGTFESAEEAARVYDAEARKLFGTFARTNFPNDSGASAA